MLAWFLGGFMLTLPKLQFRLWANRSGISSVFGLESKPWMDSRTVTCLKQKRSPCLALIFFVICDFDLFSNGPVKIIIKMCETLHSLHLGTHRFPRQVANHQGQQSNFAECKNPAVEAPTWKMPTRGKYVNKQSTFDSAKNGGNTNFSRLTNLLRSLVVPFFRILYYLVK